MIFIPVKRGEIPKMKKSIGQRLNQLMEDRNETNKALAPVLGCSPQTVGRYKDENTEMCASQLIALSKHYGVSADYLLGLTDSKTPDVTVRAIHEYTGLSDAAIKRLRYEIGLKVGADCVDSIEHRSKLSDFVSMLLSIPTYYRWLNSVYVCCVTEQTDCSDFGDDLLRAQLRRDAIHRKVTELLQNMIKKQEGWDDGKYETENH